MNYKQYKLLEEYYLEVELHFFKTKLTFAEWLETVTKNDELLEAINESKCKATNSFLSKNNYIKIEDIKKFIEAITVDSEENISNKNILVKHIVDSNYEVLAYSLKPTQSFSAFESVATRYIMNNNQVLKNGCVKCCIGGLLSSTKNTRIYLYINK